MSDPHKKVYLGDGVYAAYEEETGTVVLTTENGLTTSNTIYLEAVVLAHLVRVALLWEKERRGAK